MNTTAYQLWGHRFGTSPNMPSAFSVLADNTVPVQLFDSSTPDRTPDSRCKTVIITNPGTSPETCYVGGFNVTSSAFMIELKAGDPPLSWDLHVDGFQHIYVIGRTATAATISVQQVG